jgi:hypothetical protein
MRIPLALVITIFLSGCSLFPSYAPYKSKEEPNCSDKFGDAKRACYEQVEAVKSSIEKQINN